MGVLRIGSRVSDEHPIEHEGPAIIRFDFEAEGAPVSPDSPPSPHGPGPGPPPSAPVDSALTDNVLHADEPEPEPDENETPETALVRKLTHSLAKAVKATQLYPLENPMCRKFADELMNRINETFKAMDVIRLSVGKTKLFFGGASVLEQAGGDESVPGRLFWAGVREISFHVGLSGQEALDFLAVFRASDRKVAEGEGDIVTLLWEGRFEHITYIAIDDILDLESETDPIPDEFGSEYMNYVDLEMHDLDNEEEIDHKASEMAEQIRAKMNQEDPNLFGITADERESLLREMQEEDGPRMLTDMVRIIGETLFLETDETSFMDLVQVLSGALLALVGEGRLAEAAEVIRMLRDLRRDGEHMTAAQLTVLDAGLVSCFDPTRRESLIRHLDGGKRGCLDSLESFVAALPNDTLDAMIDVLGNLQTPLARKRMIDALSVRARENVPAFVAYLKDPRTALVRNVAAILGATGNDQALHALKGLLKHPDFHVRREGLSALSRLGSGHAMDLLGEALFDRDPRIRMAAARYLGMSGRQAIPVLITVIEAEDFDRRPLPEKRAFYEALGYAGGADMLPLLKRALHRKSLLHRGRATEIRACACEALGWVGGTEARQLLSEALHDGSVLVRTAAQSGLRRIASGKQEPLVKEAA